MLIGKHLGTNWVKGESRPDRGREEARKELDQERCGVVGRWHTYDLLILPNPLRPPARLRETEEEVTSDLNTDRGISPHATIRIQRYSHTAYRTGLRGEMKEGNRQRDSSSSFYILSSSLSLSLSVEIGTRKREGNIVRVHLASRDRRRSLRTHSICGTWSQPRYQKTCSVFIHTNTERAAAPL